MFTLPLFLAKLSHTIQSNVSHASKCVSAFSTIKSPLLTRDFIRDRLYDPDGGYFCKENLEVGELPEPLDLANMIGREAYTRILVERYPKNAWLSPTELFKPWYGLTIGSYIHHAFEEVVRNSKSSPNKEKKPKIKIIEAGAGNGSAAHGILSFFKKYQPNHYETLQYKIVDISSHMCKKAKENLQKEHKELFDKGHITTVNEDFITYNQKDDELNFVLLFEVLDDMPHDRVYYSEDKQQWHYETWVKFDDQEGGKNLREIKKPISDSLIKEAVELLNTLPAFEVRAPRHKLLEKAIKMIYNRKEGQSIFLPTCTLKMLKNIKEVLPAHHLIAADFDMLRGFDKHGANSPIVSKKLEKYFDKQDFSNYLIKRGEADIFFPTDFHYLKHAYKQICEKNADVHKTFEFMDRFAPIKWTELKDGYNPLKEDFLNTSIFTTSLSETSYKK